MKPPIHFLNSVANDKISDWSKMNALADDKLNDTQINKSVHHRLENIVEKGENAGYQHFLLFPQCFQRTLSFWASTVIFLL